MADRSIVVRLRAEHKQAVNAMNEVGAAAGKAAGEVEKAGNKMSVAEKSQERAARAAERRASQSTSSLQKMAQHAAANEQAWNTAGTALTAAGGAIIGLGVASGKAGIEFNSLKQTSGAALKSVMGSAEAASRQMDKLNDFGKDSWVMRDVLLRAQQQMTGFGVETQKVIPYLDGLQEAVAASGGSSQSFEELAGVMAKVKSEGKITATTFREFGVRGIDAAGLIGEAMGKTGEEIRASVTDGTLDADEALDALAEGMKTKFDGATENLRNTFRGAMDNLTAAWRDLSATMAEPLVGPDSGGLAVAALNGLADAITEVQDRADALPNGVKGTILALGGIAGAGTAAAGGFLLLLPRILETKKAFDTLSGAEGVLGSATRGMTKVGKAASVAAAAFTVFAAAAAVGNALADTVKTTSEMENRLRQLGHEGNITRASLDELVETSGSGGAKVSDFGYALESVNMNGFMKALDWVGSGFGAFDSDVKLAEDTIANLDQTMVGFATSGNWNNLTDTFAAAAQSAAEYGYEAEDLINLLPGLKGELLDQAEALGVGTDNATLVKIAMGEIKPAAEDAGEGFQGLSEKAQAAQEHLDEVRDSLTEAANGFLDFSEKATDSKVSLQEWIKELEGQVEAQASWMDNLAVLAERGAPQQLLDQLMSLGPEGATRVKQLADASDEDLQRVIDVFSESKRNVNEFTDAIVGIPPIDLDADASKLRGQVKTAKERLDELRELPTTPEIDAQITLLEEKVKQGRAKLKELEKEKTEPEVDADTKPAKSSVEEFDEWLKNHNNPIMNIDAKVRIINEGQIRNMPETLLNPNRKKQSAPGVELPNKATGGAIAGPGTGTSDSILAKLSNGEHVLTAVEVDRLGGQAEVYRLRKAIMDGNLPAFASGGAVGAAERRLSAAQRQLDAISNKGRKVTAEDRRRDAAQKRVDDARAALDKAKEAEAKRERITSLQSDLRQDVRRGNLRDQITGSLSGGYSAVDRLFNLGDNEDLSRGSRSKATSAARKFEANLKSLYKQADRIDEKLKDAQDKASELQSISDSVSSGLLNDRGVDVGDYQNFADGQWTTHSGVAGATRRLTADVGAMKSFAGKLKKLASKGIPGAIIQEIAQAGVAEGSTMADAFLDASDTEVQSYVGAWNEYEKYANQAGQYVTEGFYEGGLNAANGVVKGLESQQQNVEKAIANLAKTMEATFKSVLGIHSPSRVMSELGGFTAEGLVQGMLGGVTDVQSAAAALGAAAVPNMMAFQPADMNMDVGVNPVISDDEFTAGLAMQDMSATTLEAMELMRQAVASGWENMLFTTQESQAGMLEGTQTNQSGMLMALQAAQLGMLTDTQAKQAGMLKETQARQAAMLVNTQTQQEAMRQTVSQKQTDSRTKLTAEQELMRATTAQKQAATRDSLTSQQEAMRLVMADKQSRMRAQNATDFESIRSTTHSKLSSMRSATDSTMTGLHGDYSARMASLKNVNRTGFESILDAANSNMRGVREGVDRQMAAARPELGGRMNDLINVLTKFTSSVNKAFGDVGVKLDAPQKLAFATGGVMPGYTPGRDVHQFHSPTAGELYLSGGEAIMRPEFTKAVGGEQGVEALNKAARSGSNLNTLLGQFATGGVVGPIPGVNAFADSGVWRNLWAMTKEQFPNARLTSSYRPGSITASNNLSHHARGNAIDVSPSMDIFNWWRNNYGANLAELIYSPAGGKQIKNGQNYTYTGAVKAMHYNHVHIAAVRALSEAMAGGLPGAGGFSHPFLDRAGVSAGDDLSKSYAKAAEKLTAQIYAKHVKQLPDGIGGQLGKGIMSQVSEGLVEKAKEYGKNSGMDFSNVAAGPVKAMAKQMLEQMGWGDQFGDLDWLLTRESGWRPTAQNPKSTAYGLFQFLNGTWGTVGGSKTSDPKKQLEYGLKYIKQRYGDVKGARSFWNSHNWYEGGTERAKSGLAVVGEKGPELVNFRGGEQVMSTTDSMRFMAANRTYIPAQTTGAGIDYDRLAKAVVDNIPPSLVQNIDPSSLDAKRIGKAAVQEWTDKQNLYAMGARG